MVFSFKEIVFIAIILNCCFAVFVNLENTTNDGPSNAGKPNELGKDEDSYDRFSQQMVALLKSTNSLLTSINNTLKNMDERIHNLEEQIVTINTTVQTLKTENTNFRLQLSQIKEQIENTTESPLTTTTITTKSPTITTTASETTEPSPTPRTTTKPLFTTTKITTPTKSPPATTTINKQPRTPEEFLRSLTPPVEGSSFQGLTTEEIVNAIPHNFALALKIVNYLDANLTDYQLYLKYGLVHQKAPTIVFSKSRDIFTFKRDENEYVPVGVLVYQIGNSGFSIHLLFATAWRFAAGLLENKASVKTIWSAHERCWKYNHSATPTTFTCIEFENWNTTNTFLIHKDSVYAKLTVEFKEKSILKVELFKFEP